MANLWELLPDKIITLNKTKYRLLGVAGEGGSSIVYLARPITGKDSDYVMIKELFPCRYSLERIAKGSQAGKVIVPNSRYEDLETMKARAKNEAEVVKALCDDRRSLTNDQKENLNISKNPWFLSYRKPIRKNNTLYTIIETETGSTLKDMIKNEHFRDRDFAYICDCILSILNALEQVHKQGYLHLDVAPDNIFFSMAQSENPLGVARLIDYNSALRANEKPSWTLSWKEGYSAKELRQYAPTKPISINYATDLYSVAAIFFELLVGRPPRDGDWSDYKEWQLDVKNRCLVNFSSAFIEKTNATVRKGLSLRLNRRFQNVDEMRKIVEELKKQYLMEPVKKTTDKLERNVNEVSKNLGELLQTLDVNSEYLEIINKNGGCSNVPFEFDDPYKLDVAISSRTEISEISQAFNDGYKIAVLRGLPGCGKNYIARAFANTYREQFPISKLLRLKRVSNEQNLAELVISASAWRFDKGIGDTGTPEEQFNNKLSAFNKVNQGKLIIISGINEISKHDIESLAELKSHFIISTESNISDSFVKAIPVKMISFDEALALFKRHNNSDIDEKILNDVFAMLEYHIGLIIFIAKQMQQRSLSATYVKEKFNTRDIARMRVDTGLDIQTLAEYCKSMFSFSDLSKEDIFLLTLISLLPTKNHSIAFFEEYFNIQEYELLDNIIPLSKKGYINYDAKSQTLKPPFLVAKAFLESDFFEIDIAKDVLISIYDILEWEGCKDFSVIQEKLNYGVVAAERLSSINAFDDAELCLKIANGYKDLCFIDDAQKYADMAIILRKDKKISLQVIHLKVDIMIFRFDFKSTVDYLEAQINQIMWEEYSNKEKGEILYKIGLMYNYLRLFDKSMEYLKNSFYAFKDDECIVGEFACLNTLMKSSSNRHIYEQELKTFIEDGNALLESEPFWSFIAFALRSFIGDILFDAKFDVRNLSMDKLFDAVDNIDDTEADHIINDMEIIRSYLKTKADEGGALERAVYNFLEVSEKTIESWAEDEEFDKNLFADSAVSYMSEALKKLREINIPLSTEIEMLKLINGGFIKEMGIVDDSIIEAKALQLLEQRYNALLPTVSEKLLATKSYAQIASPQKAVTELEQQIELLEKHLPQEHRYPLASLYEELAYRYNDLVSATKDDEYHEKCTKSILNSIDTLKSIPDTSETQARLFRYIRDYDSAISILENNGIVNCQLCSIYFRKTTELLSKKKWDDKTIESAKFFYNKIQSFRTKVSDCSNSCYSYCLYEVGKNFSGRRVHCSEEEYAVLLTKAIQNKEFSVFRDTYDTSANSEIKSAALWFEKAAEANHANALYEMGMRYYFGYDGKKQDYNSAFIWFEKAANQGHNKAQFEVCFCLYGGIGVEENVSLAYKWLEKAKESTSDENQEYLRNYFDDFMNPSSPEIKYQIGYCYYDGQLVEKSHIIAAKWFSKSAEHGYPKAQNALGVFYKNGYGETLVNYKKAAEMFRLSAEQGYSMAQNNLGGMYKEGQGVLQDYIIASELYLQAAEQGHKFAQYNLAQMFEMGLGVSEDYNKSALWYQKSADQGYSEAQFKIGKCYHTGIGVEQNTKTAIDYFEKAVAQGHIEAKREKEKCRYSNACVKEIPKTNTEHLYQYLQDNSCFGKAILDEDSKIIVHTGCMYDDMTEIIICISVADDKIVLTDGGYTHDYLDNIFELDEPDVIKNITASTDYFGIKYENGHLSVEVDSFEKISESVLKLFYGIGFLNSMKIFYV